MRVLHLYSGNLYGGVERTLVTLIREHQACAEMQTQIALCYEGRLADELRANGYSPIMLQGGGRVRMSRPWTVFQVRRRLEDVLDKQSPDIAICHSYWPHILFAPVLQRNGIPLVFNAHDVPTGKHWLERMTRLTRPDLVIANSRHTASSVGLLFGSTMPCEVHLPPVCVPPPMDRAALRRELRRELLSNPDDVIILMACRMERFKGHQTLIKALDALRHLPQWTCWIASGPQRRKEVVYREELLAAARALGLTQRIRFLGQRADVRQLMAAADIHCQPNWLPEAFGVSFVEAFYAGLPVVSTAMGGAAEIVGHDRHGLLVQPQNVAALAGALGDLIVDPQRRRRLGDAGPARARELCDPRIALPRLYRSMLQLCASRAKGIAPAAQSQEDRQPVAV